MFRRKICLIFVVLVLGVVGSAFAIDSNWTNGGGDRAWDNASNWSAGVPTTLDKAAIRNDTILGPIIDSATAAVSNQVVIGDWGSTVDTLDMTGGTLSTGDWFILGYGSVNNGTFTISGGTADIGGDLYVGYNGAGTLDMNGGTINVTATLKISQDLIGSTGTVTLDGGTISSGAIIMTSGGTMDITAGTLIVNGDVTATVNTYIGNGWITAYGGGGTLNVDYNVSNPLKTTVTASMPTVPPGKAINPTPPNGATGVSIIPTLSWTPGTDTTSHDVYFGTNDPPTFRGNQIGNTFDPGILEQNTLYYWRIDEKNIIGTTTGDVWSFTTVDDTSYSLVGKVMCGYQGWFNCPGDGTPIGWQHWGRLGSFTPDICTVDFWPDMTEYSAGEKFLAPDFYDGTDHYVFSSHNLTTVRRHFQWMQEYDIDGVYLERFANEIAPGSALFNHRNDVLDYCKDAANLYGRKYAVMYDLNNLTSGSQVQQVVDDWMFLVDNGKIPQDPSHDPGYMFHQNKPVVAVWGLSRDEPYEGEDTYNLINFFKNDPTYGGNTVMIGVGRHWLDNTDPWFQQTRDLADIISPWLVGAFVDTSGANNWANNKGTPDKAWCDANGKDYLPVVWPGFSVYNKNGGPFNQIPREGGQFFWDQVYANVSTVDATMLFVAMFDEVDEGTAIFKLSNDPPQVSPAQFVTLDVDGYDVPGDEYLWLAGQARKALRGEIPLDQTRPDRSEVCDDGTCDPGEDQCNCPEDCGTPPSTETNCTDGIDEDCDLDVDCDDADCNTDPACICGNGTCDPGEDCTTCPADCISRTTPPKHAYCCGDGTCEGAEDQTNCAVDCGGGSYCDDGTCDPGEDQCNCPQDCGTPPSTETSCTDGEDNDCDTDVDCDDTDCIGDPACPSCDDGTCDPGEDQCNCPEDCGTPPATETNCTDGIDEDCDGQADCDDPTGDCDLDPACDCAAVGEACTVDSDCCSNNCFERKGYCKN